MPARPPASDFAFVSAVAPSPRPVGPRPRVARGVVRCFRLKSRSVSVKRGWRGGGSLDGVQARDGVPTSGPVRRSAAGRDLPQVLFSIARKGAKSQDTPLLGINFPVSQQGTRGCQILTYSSSVEDKSGQSFIPILTEKRGGEAKGKRTVASSGRLAATERGSSRPQESSVGARMRSPNVPLVQFLQTQSRRQCLEKATFRSEQVCRNTLTPQSLEIANTATGN